MSRIIEALRLILCIFRDAITANSTTIDIARNVLKFGTTAARHANLAYHVAFDQLLGFNADYEYGTPEYGRSAAIDRAASPFENILIACFKRATQIKITKDKLPALDVASGPFSSVQTVYLVCRPISEKHGDDAHHGHMQLDLTTGGTTYIYVDGSAEFLAVYDAIRDLLAACGFNIRLSSADSDRYCFGVLFSSPAVSSCSSVRELVGRVFADYSRIKHQSDVDHRSDIKEA